MAKSETLKVEGKDVFITNLDKVYYPKTGFTKGEMIAYYIKIAPYVLPHLKDRPLTMKRYPNGVDAPFFYEKQCPKPTPAFVKTCKVARHHESGSIEYCLVNNLPTLVWAANLGDLELHTFLSKAPKVEKPTQIVFDLDPGPPANAVQCAQVALWLKEILSKSRPGNFYQVFRLERTAALHSAEYRDDLRRNEAVCESRGTNPGEGPSRSGRLRHERASARQGAGRLEPELRDEDDGLRLFAAREGTALRVDAARMVGSRTMPEKEGALAGVF